MERISRRGALAGLGALLASGRAQAGGYPDHPVKIVVPFAPAGPTDIMARIMAAHLGERLGGSFIVENRPGAGGNLGAGVVAHAEPDGYTLLITSSALVVSPGLYKRVPYDIDRDLAPISELGTSPNVIVAHPAAGISSIADLIAKAKAAPGTLSFGSPGIGSTPHLAMEMLQVETGIKLVHVPYGGAGPAVQSALAGTTPLACVALAPAQPHIASGALIGVALTAAKRWSDLPNLSTSVEQGQPKLVTDTWQGFLAPAKTPAEILAKLGEAASAILRDPAVAKQLHDDAFEVLSTDAAQFRKQIDLEVAQWRDLIKQAGLQTL